MKDSDGNDDTTEGSEKQPAPKLQPGVHEQEESALKIRKEPQFDGYNLKDIEDFLDVVFHNHQHETGQVMLWRVARGKAPQYPETERGMYLKLRNRPEPRAMYFGTSTCSPDPESKGLRNRKSLFAELHVIVLDDIGTKVPIEKLPKDFKPTYSIETSAGNFQYGYVLDEPISDLGAAEALVQLAYESGYSDEGGKMPTKLVRLPAGINGKPGEKGDFQCKLHHKDGPRYSPQQILDKMELGIDWQDVLDDAEEVTKVRIPAWVEHS